MSNYEYDSLYDELTALEKETGTVLYETNAHDKLEPASRTT